MRKALFSELAKIDDVTFFLLEHHVSIARLIRNTITEEGLEYEYMADILGVPRKKIQSVLNGAYPFDFVILAKLQRFRQDRARAKAKFKIRTEGVNS